MCCSLPFTSLLRLYLSTAPDYINTAPSSLQGMNSLAWDRGSPAQAMSSNATNSTLWWLCGVPNATRESSIGDDLPSALAQALNTNCGFRGAAADHRFVLFKTHKTGSSTLQLMLARIAYIRRLKAVGCIFDVGSHFFQSGGCNLTLPLGVVARDFGVRHNFAKTLWWKGSAAHYGCDHGDGQWFDQLIDHTYPNIMKNAAGPDHHVPIIIPTREPGDHMRSVLHYYNVSSQKFASASDLWNPLAKDFRLLSLSQVQQFVRRWPQNQSNSKRIFPVVLEDFDVSLVTLRRQLRWDLSDMVYTRVVHNRDVHAATMTNGMQPSTLQVPPDWTSWDTILYTAFVELHQLQKQAILDSTFQQEVVALHRMSMALEALCNEAGTSQAGTLDVPCMFARASEGFAEHKLCESRANV